MIAEKSGTDIRNAAWCSAVALMAMLLCMPWANLSFDDDWSYAFTVKRLAESGHIFYNGWSSPLLITQAYWAWLWVKLFGFSFNVLRWSMMPLAAAAVGVSCLLARRCGLNARGAVFVSLMLGLSPLFLPMATSFMNDVPGCLGILVSLYAFVRCAQALSAQGATVWLLIGVSTGAIGGLSRQSVWIVPLVLLPCLAWLRRKERGVVAAAVIFWLVTLTAAVGFQHWFELQPFAIPEPAFGSELAEVQRDPWALVVRVIELLLTWILFLLPVTITAFSRLRSRQLVALTAVVLLGFCTSFSTWHRLEVAPWMENTFTPVGVMGNGQIAGAKPLVLRYPIMPMLAIAVFTTGSAIIALGSAWFVTSGLKQLKRYAVHPAGETAAVAALVLVTGSYLLLLTTRCAQNFCYDRHLLPLIPIGGILLLRSLRVGCGARRIPAACWALLAIFGIYAIASTQDDLALARARASAASRLTDAGIPRGQIAAGLEYDFWTQLLAVGHINNVRIKNPAGIFQPHLGFTPTLHPAYRLEFQSAADALASKFGGVSYFSFLPPFHRRVLIDRVK